MRAGGGDIMTTRVVRNDVVTFVDKQNFEGLIICRTVGYTVFPFWGRLHEAGSLCFQTEPAAPG